LRVEQVDTVAQALADPIRRQILQLLRAAPATAGAIALAFPVSRPAVSRHLRVLREAGLVRDETRGRERRYELDVSALAPLEIYLGELHAPSSPWQRRFDALETEVQRVRRRKAQQSASEPKKKRPAARQRKETA
jgi:DNA-binding transcriptional ArsR family regulator